MNMLEAVVAGILIDRKQSFLWAAAPGAGRWALVQLVAAALLIGCMVGTMEIAERTARPATGTTANVKVPAFHLAPGRLSGGLTPTSSERTTMELGVYTFGVNGPDPQTGRPTTVEQRFADLLEEIELADQVGLDVFGLGEHHRPEFIVSTPAVVLAAAATRTKRIRLTSAVTVLSSDDPVRVFQEFAALDNISRGRAEIMAGRGSFIESFPLFGYDLKDYDSLFSEKLDLLLQIRSGERVKWAGKHRAALNDLPVYPRPVQNPLPVWVAVGGTPQSVVRAGTLGLPMALAIIGGEPERFAPFVELYRESVRRADKDPSLPVGINSHGYIADTSQEAADEAWPSVSAAMNQIGRERGWPPMSRAQYDASTKLRGANFIGSPEQVVEKILFQHEIFGHERFLIQFSVGPLPHKSLMRSIELFGTKVAPAVRKALGETATSPLRPPNSGENVAKLKSSG